jgi:hypothetical protein
MNEHKETGFHQRHAGGIAMEFSQREHEQPMVTVTFDDVSPAIELPSACFEGLAIAAGGQRSERDVKKFLADLKRVLEFITGSHRFFIHALISAAGRLKSRSDQRKLLENMTTFFYSFAGKSPHEQTEILNAIRDGEEACVKQSRQRKKPRRQERRAK